jgi:hypothetical protein
MRDLLLTDEIQIKNGDFAIGESDKQHTQHILIANKGEYKNNPALGVGIEKMLSTEEPMEFLIDAKKNLEYDGMKVKNIAFTEKETILVDAKYTNQWQD